MAPPRTTKASSHSNLANATRQGTRKSNKQNDEDDEEMEESDNIESMDVDDEESTEPPTTSAQELIANMVEGQRKRHLGKKRKVIKDYDANARTVQESIDTLFNEHEEQSASAHEAQLERLKELFAHKTKLEAAMETKLTTLRAEYDAHSQDMEKVVSCKVKGLK